MTASSGDLEGFRKTLAALRQAVEGATTSDIAISTITPAQQREDHHAPNSRNHVLDQEQITQLHAEIDELKMRLRDEQEHGKEWDAKVQALKEVLEKEREERRALDIANRELVKEKQERQGKAAVFNSIRRSLQETIDDLQRKLDEEQTRSKKQLNRMQKKVQTTKKENDKLNECFGRLEAEKLGAERRAQDVVDEKSRLEDDVARWKKRVDEAQSTINELQKRVSKQESVEKSRSPTVEHNKSPSVAETQNSCETSCTILEARSMIDDLRASLERADERASVLERQQGESKETHQQLLNDQKKLMGKIDELQTKSEQLRSDVEDQRKLVVLKDKQAKLLQAKLKRKEEEMSARVSKLEHELKATKEELQSAEGEGKRLRDELKSLSEKNSTSIASKGDGDEDGTTKQAPAKGGSRTKGKQNRATGSRNAKRGSASAKSPSTASKKDNKSIDLTTEKDEESSSPPKGGRRRSSRGVKQSPHNMQTRKKAKIAK